MYFCPDAIEISLAFVVDIPAGHKKVIGQTVDIAAHRIANVFSLGLLQFDDTAFGAAADRSRHMKCGCGLGAPGEDKRGERRHLAIHEVDFAFQPRICSSFILSGV